MEVLAHGRRRRHGRQGLGSHVLRVRARVAHPPDAVDGADVDQQLGEQRSQTGAGVAVLAGGHLQVAAVRVDVLTEQGDLGDTVLGELAHLVEHVVVRPADLGAAHGGHDAEGAVVVAPDLDRDPGVVAGLAPGGQRRREHGVVVDHRLFQDLDQRTIAANGLAQ